MNREQAVERLRALGYKAKARDWNMGTTIFIPLGEPIEGPVTAYRGVVYLCPADGSHFNVSKRWMLTDFHYIERTYDNLEEAVHGVDAYIKFITPYLRA